MALTRNDKLLILAAVVLASAVVGGLAWWRTSARQAEILPSATSQQTAQLPVASPPAEHKVLAPPEAKPAVTAPLAPSIPAAPQTEPDKSLQSIFTEEPKPAVEAPPAPAEKPEVKPELAAPKKPETKAERKARLAAERKAEAEAKRAEAQDKKDRAESLRRAQEELRKAEAELKRAAQQTPKEQTAKPQTPAEPQKPAEDFPSMGAVPEAPATAKPEAAPTGKTTEKQAERPKPGPERRIVDKITVSENGDEMIFTLHGASTAARPEAMLLLTPPRLVIDLPGAWTFKGPEKPAGGQVKALRVGAHPDKLRLVLDLANTPKGPKHPAVDKTPDGLVIKLNK